jgi:uncharacterized protein YggU (UPF0235/DUF167 family)
VAFGVSRSSVTLVTGAASRHKVIGVSGSAEALAKRLDELLRR